MSRYSTTVELLGVCGWVEYEDGSRSIDTSKLDLGPGDEDFSVPLKLVNGKTTIVCKTRGRVKDLATLLEVPNDREKDDRKFVLNLGNAQGNGTFTLTATNYMGTFVMQGNPILLYSRKDQPGSGNGDYSDYTQWTMTGTPCTSLAELPIDDLETPAGSFAVD